MGDLESQMCNAIELSPHSSWIARPRSVVDTSRWCILDPICGRFCVLPHNASSAECIAMYDCENMHTQWSLTLDSPASTVFWPGGEASIFFGTRQGRVICASASSGERLFDVLPSRFASPVIGVWGLDELSVDNCLVIATRYEVLILDMRRLREPVGSFHLSSVEGMMSIESACVMPRASDSRGDEFRASVLVQGCAATGCRLAPLVVSFCPSGTSEAKSLSILGLDGTHADVTKFSRGKWENASDAWLDGPLIYIDPADDEQQAGATSAKVSILERTSSNTGSEPQLILRETIHLKDCSTSSNQLPDIAYNLERNSLMYVGKDSQVKECHRSTSIAAANMWKKPESIGPQFSVPSAFSPGLLPARLESTSVAELSDTPVNRTQEILSKEECERSDHQSVDESHMEDAVELSSMEHQEDARPPPNAGASIYLGLGATAQDREPTFDRYSTSRDDRISTEEIRVGIFDSVHAAPCVDDMLEAVKAWRSSSVAPQVVRDLLDLIDAGDGEPSDSASGSTQLGLGIRNYIVSECRDQYFFSSSQVAVFTLVSLLSHRYCRRSRASCTCGVCFALRTLDEVRSGSWSTFSEWLDEWLSRAVDQNCCIFAGLVRKILRDFTPKHSSSGIDLTVKVSTARGVSFVCADCGFQSRTRVTVKSPTSAKSLTGLVPPFSCPCLKSM